MLLVSAPGSREERTERNSRFHALNQAIVQLVSHTLWFMLRPPFCPLIQLSFVIPDAMGTFRPTSSITLYAPVLPMHTCPCDSCPGLHAFPCAVQYASSGLRGDPGQ